jgi:hypothetical protein
MDQELIETVARAIHRQHGKEMLGELRKWEERTPRERSSWRLIARAAIKLVHEGQAADAGQRTRRAAAPIRVLRSRGT